jgi:hypothetical protein
MALALAWSRACMDGRATFTAKKSRTIMKTALINTGRDADGPSTVRERSGEAPTTGGETSVLVME